MCTLSKSLEFALCYRYLSIRTYTMSTLSQRLLHTSLAYRVGATTTTRQIVVPSRIAEAARDLIPSRNNDEDPNPIKPFDPGMVSPPQARQAFSCTTD